MPATFSPEARIENGLRVLMCSGRNFVDVAKSLNVKISHGGLSEGLKKGFDRGTPEKLLEVLELMRSLQEAVDDAPVNWARTERVVTALTIRKVAQVAAEMNDHGFDATAASATKLVSGI